MRKQMRSWPYGDSPRGNHVPARTALWLAAALGLLLVLALAGCKKPVDRIFTADGQVIAGRIAQLSQRVLVLEDSSLVRLPDGPARVHLRSGASYVGSVEITDERKLHVNCDLGDLGFELRNVAVISWADEAASHVLLDVPACAGWLNTHVAVSEGDLISLAAGGSATMLGQVSGPEGLERMTGASSTAPEANDGRLMLRVGERGAEHTVGRSWSAESPAEGEIFLAVNSPLSGSDGTYTVSLMISRRESSGSMAFAIYPAIK